MKKIFALSALFLGLTLMSFTPETEKYPTIENGTEMPMADHAMIDISGDKMTLSDAKKENGTIVIFSCNTCPFVVMWEDRYDDIMQIANRMNVGVILVNSNEAKRDGDDSVYEMQKHAEEQNYSAPYVVDQNSTLANGFGAKTTPHVFMFDGSDMLVYQGAIDDNYEDRAEVTENYLQDAIFAVYKGIEIEVAETAPKGCSIKRGDK